MTDLLGYESYLVPLGASQEDVFQLFKTIFTSYGWQVVSRTWAYAATLGTGTSIQYCFDNLANIGFSALINAGQTGGVQMAAPFTVATYAIDTYSTINSGIRAWTIDYSDNGSTWTTCDTRVNEVKWSIGERRYFTIGGSPGAHAYWRITITTLESSGNLPEVRFFNAAGEWISNENRLYVIPPVSETIGDSNQREVVCLSFTGTALRVQSCVQILQDMPQSYMLWEKTAGAVACGVYLSAGAKFDLVASASGTVLTVTGVTGGTLAVGAPIYHANAPIGTYISSLGTGAGGVGTYNLSQSTSNWASATLQSAPSVFIAGTTGSASSTAKDNLRSLYTALKNSVDPVATAWTWKYQKSAPQNANDTYDYIYGVLNAYGQIIYVGANTNVNAAILGNSVRAGFAGLESMPGGPPGITTTGTLALVADLVSGFIYYLQINKRGFALATKTNIGYYGPVHACYADHAKAASALPPSILPRAAALIELVVGIDGAVSTTSASYAYPAKSWTLFHTTYGTLPNSGQNNGGLSVGVNYYGGGFILKDQFTDAWIGSYGNSLPNTSICTITLCASGLFSNTGSMATADDFQIHRMTMSGLSEFAGNALVNAIGAVPAFVPMLDIQDWYRFVGTATNETLSLVSDTVNTTTLNQAMDATTAYTILTLTDTTLLAAAGYIIIEGEVIQYTGKTPTTITGCTRAKYGTVMQAHWVGDVSSQGLWFTIMNGGALFCGTTKPV